MEKAFLKNRERTNKDRKLRDIRRYGSQCMSYSCMQDSIKEFRHPAFQGFIPFTSVWGVDYVLSDPITPKKDYLLATVLFMAQHKRSVFCQVSYVYAALLSRLGCKVNGFGVENIITLSDFRVTWKKRKCLKSYLSKLKKQSFYVFAMQPEKRTIQRISEQWLKDKSQSRELTFMARPFVDIKEEDVRYFYLIKDQNIIGFCSFDPIYSADQDGQIQSFTLQHLRVLDKVPLGSQDYLILNALEQFKDEGYENISLGLAPLYKRNDCYFRKSLLADKAFSLIYKFSALYNYNTIGQHKDHYKAKQVQTFVAAHKDFSMRKLGGIFKVNNLI